MRDGRKALAATMRVSCVDEVNRLEGRCDPELESEVQELQEGSVRSLVVATNFRSYAWQGIPDSRSTITAGYIGLLMSKARQPRGAKRSHVTKK